MSKPSIFRDAAGYRVDGPAIPSYLSPPHTYVKHFLGWFHIISTVLTSYVELNININRREGETMKFHEFDEAFRRTYREMKEEEAVDTSALTDAEISFIKIGIAGLGVSKEQMFDETVANAHFNAYFSIEKGHSMYCITVPVQIMVREEEWLDGDTQLDIDIPAAPLITITNWHYRSRSERERINEVLFEEHADQIVEKLIASNDWIATERVIKDEFKLIFIANKETQSAMSA